MMGKTAKYLFYSFSIVLIKAMSIALISTELAIIMAN